MNERIIQGTGVNYFPVHQHSSALQKEEMNLKLVNADIINCLQHNSTEIQTLKELDRLVKHHGSAACQVIFQVLADLQFNPDEAVIYWRKLYNHNIWLAKKLGRPISLVTSMCDYFSHHKNLFDPPKLTTFKYFERLFNQSTFDRLTGLLNRNCFDETLTHLLALTQREGTELSLAFFDIDDFKIVNDNNGHQIGDYVLKTIGKLIANSIRLSDIALRYGGEEFVVLMPHTDCNKALMLSNRIRENIEKQPFIENGINLNITISGGVAVYPLQAHTAKELISFADNALYRAKGSGKNNIAVYKNENRHCLRIPVRKKLEIKRISFAESSINSGLSKNIGNGGILFENAHKYQEGSFIQISLKLNDNEPTLLLGKVIRTRAIAKNRYIIAVSFAIGDMEKLAKKEIFKFIIKSNGSLHSE